MYAVSIYIYIYSARHHRISPEKRDSQIKYMQKMTPNDAPRGECIKRESEGCGFSSTIVKESWVIANIAYIGEAELITHCDTHKAHEHLRG